MKPPAIERAVHTTPPIKRPASMPYLPLRPAPDRITLEIISVISVIPETGLVPTIAIALAATEVNIKLIIRTTRRAIMLMRVTVAASYVPVQNT